MKKLVAFLSLVLGAGSIAAAAAEAGETVSGSLPAGPYRVGFRMISEQDEARSIRVTGAKTVIRPRPVRVYVWYPASPPAEARPMTFGRYAALADEDVWPEEILPGAPWRDRWGRSDTPGCWRSRCSRWRTFLPRRAASR